MSTVDPVASGAGPNESFPAGNGEGPGASADDLLKERLAAVEKEREEFRSLLQLTRAEFENYQKRIQRELVQERRYAHAAFAREMLPVFDNFERTVAAARQAGESSPLVEGVAMIQAQVLDLLKRHGISRIDPVGEPFDPNVHEAVSRMPAEGQAADSVIQVLESGYLIHDRVLRPARVIVAAPPTPDAKSAGGE